MIKTARERGREIKKVDAMNKNPVNYVTTTEVAWKMG
jgi:hypothetical protein